MMEQDQIDAAWTLRKCAVAENAQLVQIPRIIRHDDHQVDVTVPVRLARGLRTEQLDLQRVQRLNKALHDLLKQLIRKLFHAANHNRCRRQRHEAGHAGQF